VILLFMLRLLFCNMFVFDFTGVFDLFLSLICIVVIVCICYLVCLLDLFWLGFCCFCLMVFTFCVGFVVWLCIFGFWFFGCFGLLLLCDYLFIWDVWGWIFWYCGCFCKVVVYGDLICCILCFVCWFVGGWVLWFVCVVVCFIVLLFGLGLCFILWVCLVVLVCGGFVGWV